MIEIKKTCHHNMDFSISKIKPENIILLCVTRDQFFDGPSDDMGWFYDIIHQEGEDILWDYYNPFIHPLDSISFEPVSWLTDPDHLEQRTNIIYTNKKNRNDFKITDGKLVFKDKYILKPDEDMLSYLKTALQ